MECKQCGEIEPYHWDLYSDGLWFCKCLTQNKKKVKRINGKKPLDYALEKVIKKLDNKVII